MQREKSVKIKEVIESLSKLLCAMGVEAVPSAETFRRAKFNKEDAVPEMCQLLYGVLKKTFIFECECTAACESDLGAQLRLTRWMLFQCGYGAPWLLGDGSQEVGSRELLLAFGWVLSSGSLLEHLLLEAALGPLALTAVPDVSLGVLSSRDPLVTSEVAADPELGSPEWENGLKRLLWQCGKLTFQRRSLLAAQEERASLLHQVLSTIDSFADTEHRAAGAHPSSGSAGQSEVLEKMEKGTQVLERYLGWKLQETVFWSWMSSVIDAKLDEPVPSVPEGAVAVDTQGAAIGGGCPQAGRGRRGALEQLGDMLQTLKTGLRDVWAEPWVKECDDSCVTDTERAEAQERVRAKLHNLTEAYRPGIANTTPLRLYWQGHPDCPCRHGPGPRGAAAASDLIRELREREAVLQAELARWRQGDREAVEEQANGLEALVLIPPLKR